MSKKNGSIPINKMKSNGTNKIKYKISLIDLAIKKTIFSKKLLLKFFRGKTFQNLIFVIK